MIIKAIFCDVDGVLFQQNERFSVKYSNEFGIPINKMNAYLDNDFDLCLTGKDNLKLRLTDLLEEWKWKGTVDELTYYWYGKESIPHKKFIDFLNSLDRSNIKLFLASQNEKYKMTRMMDQLEPLIKYDHLIATYQVGYKKSNPLYFTTCLEKYNLKPNEVVLIDNNIKAINCAKSVGISTIFFESEIQAIFELRKMF